ncbi:MAG: CerR family C-terminal domain-containing protein [Gammaproteobacteria bacterium]|nr:CerR family C-terminal domain-containing protein [Gammaproteobacteria bacterium]
MVENTESSSLALIHAAIELFGRDGYSAVSTRTLSKKAGTNLAAIKYHFGGKDDLYLAALEHVIALLSPQVEMARTMFDQGKGLAGNDPVRQAQLVSNLVEGLLNIFLRNKEMQAFIPFVIREFFVPGKHFAIFYEALPRRVHELVTEMVAMVQDSDPEAQETIIRAHGLVGQLVIFNLGREILFRRMNWQEYTDERISLITAELTAQFIRSLGLEVLDDNSD